MATHEERGTTRLGRKTRGLASGPQRGTDTRPDGRNYFYDESCAPYRVELEFDPDNEMALTAMQISRTDGRSVSGRAVRRLPLTSLIEIGRVYVAWPDAGKPPRVPRGQPDRKSANYYKEIADAYMGFKRQGKSPAKEIAARKNIPINTVYQQIHQARKLFPDKIEPAPRRRRLQDDEA